MRKKKTVALNVPCLKLVRNNFRNAIKCACRIEQSKIHNEQEELMKEDRFYDDEIYRHLSRDLDDQYWAIERPLRASILLCPICFNSEKNMTYNPVRKVWFCVGCYKKLQKGNQERGTPEEFP